jgi:hypothetical protein
MIIGDLVVSGFGESIRASGFPHENKDKTATMNRERAIKLAHAPIGSGHDSFLKGITVSADVTASQAWWMQFMRYHFVDIVSSTSKMHSLLKLDLDEICNTYVNRRTINFLNELIEQHEKETCGITKKEIWNRILYNVPMGLELKGRVITNFLQLKTIYKQRKNHRLGEWDTFSAWIEELDEWRLIT